MPRVTLRAGSGDRPPCARKMRGERRAARRESDTQREARERREQRPCATAARAAVRDAARSGTLRGRAGPGTWCETGIARTHRRGGESRRAGAAVDATSDVRPARRGVPIARRRGVGDAAEALLSCAQCGVAVGPRAPCPAGRVDPAA